MTPFLLACSGPGAMQAIYENIAYAQQHAIVVGGLAVLSITFWLMSHRLRPLLIGVLLLLLSHPAWTVSAIHGDCGFAKASLATFVTIVAATCVALQTLAWIWPDVGRKALRFLR